MAEQLPLQLKSKEKIPIEHEVEEPTVPNALFDDLDDLDETVFHFGISFPISLILIGSGAVTKRRFNVPATSIENAVDILALDLARKYRQVYSADIGKRDSYFYNLEDKSDLLRFRTDVMKGIRLGKIKAGIEGVAK